MTATLTSLATESRRAAPERRVERLRGVLTPPPPQKPDGRNVGHPARRTSRVGETHPSYRFSLTPDARRLGMHFAFRISRTKVRSFSCHNMKGDKKDGR